jgi:hypothetical protein
VQLFYSLWCVELNLPIGFVHGLDNGLLVSDFFGCRVQIMLQSLRPCCGACQYRLRLVVLEWSERRNSTINVQSLFFDEAERLPGRSQAVQPLAVALCSLLATPQWLVN